jgi:hypothetical protein
MRIKGFSLVTAAVVVVALAISVVEWRDVAAGNPSGSITGIVVDDRGPVPGARVRIQGSQDFVVTDGSGNFIIAGLAPGKKVNVSAWKEGYYSALSRDVSVPGAQVRLTLVAYQINDNRKYRWLPPEGKDIDKNCSACHPDIVEMSLKDAHLNSARNPRFLTMYYGTDVHGNRSPLTRYEKGKTISAWVNMLVPLPPDQSKPYYGPGFQLDSPGAAGNCSSCHVPGASLRGNVDPASVQGADKYGIHCDFCHKIANVRIRETTGMPFPRLPGVEAMDLRRPFPNDPKRSQLFFGTFEDVNVGEGDTNLPLLKESRYCASCHFGIFWDTVVYNSYGEWLGSPYSDPKSGKVKTCQECHMPSPTIWMGKPITNIAPGKGGIERDPATIHSHNMTVDEALLQNSLSTLATAGIQGDRVVVEVRLTNDKTGHHVPTDSPLRHLILLVEGKDEAGKPLALLEGPTLPDWCGKGDPANGYYSGLPGKAYAKLLKELWTDVFPTGAYWNHTEIVSDNRLAAFASDATAYAFARPEKGDAKITIKLLYRRAFKNIMDWKKWDSPDIVMHEKRLSLVISP